MAIHTMLWLALLALLCNSIPGALAKQNLRVRKELRKLSRDELNLFKSGVDVMQKVSTADGQALFGQHYKEYNHFIIQHAVAVYDPRGDQGHYSPSLGVFHRILMLEFEAALLSVVPKLKALPYWDITLDAPGAKYWNTTKSITSWKYMGPIDGDARIKYQVTQGASAYRNIGHFDFAIYGQWAPIFNGTNGTHLLRSATYTSQNNSMLTRYPSWVMADVAKGMNWTSMLEYLVFDPEDPKKAIGVNLTAQDYALCYDANFITNFTRWNWCVDESSMSVGGAKAYKSGLIHPGMHMLTGSYSPESLDAGAKQIGGDCLDVATSPNEAFMFWVHHTNMDRNLMMWQANAAALDPSMASDSVMWKYPKSAAEYSGGWSGIYLGDVINSAFPFTYMGDGLSSTTGFTHFELLNLTKPGLTAHYIYDNMKSLKF